MPIYDQDTPRLRAKVLADYIRERVGQDGDLTGRGVLVGGQTLRLTAYRCGRYGQGSAYLVVCPTCGRGCKWLYNAGGGWACRKCYRITRRNDTVDRLDRPTGVIRRAFRLCLGIPRWNDYTIVAPNHPCLAR